MPLFCATNTQLVTGKGCLIVVWSASMNASSIWFPVNYLKRYKVKDNIIIETLVGVAFIPRGSLAGFRANKICCGGCKTTDLLCKLLLTFSQILQSETTHPSSIILTPAVVLLGIIDGHTIRDESKHCSKLASRQSAILLQYSEAFGNHSTWGRHQDQLGQLFIQRCFCSFGCYSPPYYPHPHHP